MSKKAEVIAKLTGQELEIAQRIYTASFPKLVELTCNSGRMEVAAKSMSAAIREGLIELRQESGSKP